MLQFSINITTFTDFLVLFSLGVWLLFSVSLGTHGGFTLMLVGRLL